MTPAPAVTWPAAASTGSSRVSRSSESTTWVPLPSGTPAPTRPVPPPRGTTAMRCAVAARSTALTSSVPAGRTTARARPTNRPVQSRS